MELIVSKTRWPPRRHVEHSEMVCLVVHLERLAVVTGRRGDLARPYNRAEVHLDLQRPSPEHASQRPPLTLNENRRAGSRGLDLRWCREQGADPCRTPGVLAGLDRGGRPIATGRRAPIVRCRADDPGVPTWNLARPFSLLATPSPGCRSQRRFPDRRPRDRGEQRRNASHVLEVGSRAPTTVSCRFIRRAADAGTRCSLAER
jgi:hypothetical protein